VLLSLAGLLALVRITAFDGVGGTGLSLAEWAMSDFKSVVYYPAKAFAAGDNPYDTTPYLARYPASFGFYMYPPVVLILNAPIAALPFGWAVAVKVAMTLMFTGLLALVSLRLAGTRARVAGVFFMAALILLSRPGQWNLLLGQVTIPIVLAAYAALALDRRRTMLTGCALALCLVKPNFGVPVAVVMLGRGQAVAVALGVAFILLLNLPLVGILADRAGGIVRLAELALGGEHTLGEAVRPLFQLTYHRVDLAALASQLAWFSLGKVGPLLIAGLVLGLVLVALRSDREQGGRAMPSAVSGLVCSGILLCVYHPTYDLLLLTWPFAALALQVAATGRDTPPWQWIALGLLTVLAGNYLATATVMETARPYPLLSLTLASLNGVALLVLFGLYLHAVVKPGPRLAPISRGPPG
jgi:hypothetical protein